VPGKRCLWQVALARRRKSISGAPSAPVPPVALLPHRRQVEAIVANSGHLSFFIVRSSTIPSTYRRREGIGTIVTDSGPAISLLYCALLTIPSTYRRRGGSVTGGADGGPLMKNLLAAGKCHLPEPTLAEPVSIRMSPTPPEDFSAGRRQQRQDPCSDRNAASLR